MAVTEALPKVWDFGDSSGVLQDQVEVCMQICNRKSELLQVNQPEKGILAKSIDEEAAGISWSWCCFAPGNMYMPKWTVISRRMCV